MTEGCICITNSFYIDKKKKKEKTGLGDEGYFTRKNLGSYLKTVSS